MKDLKIWSYTITKDAIYSILFVLFIVGVVFGANYAMMEGGSESSIILLLSWIPAYVIFRKKIYKGIYRRDKV